MSSSPQPPHIHTHADSAVGVRSLLPTVSEAADYTVGSPSPPCSAGAASSSPGQGGVVWQRNRRGCVRGGGELEAPARGDYQRVAGRHVPAEARRRHRRRAGSATRGRGLPGCTKFPRRYGGTPARETCPAGRTTSTRLLLSAPWRPSASSRISDPSGAYTSGASPRREGRGTGEPTPSFFGPMPLPLSVIAISLSNESSGRYGQSFAHRVPVGNGKHHQHRHGQ